MQVNILDKNVIRAIAITRKNIGDKILIPRISSDSRLAF